MIKKCKVCGKEFETKSNRAIYCSDKCKRAAIREKEKPTLIKRAKDMSRDKNKVYSLYQCKCAICGWQISENLVIRKGKALPSYGCEIHHIVPVSEGGSGELDNLIMLCPNCHKKADYGVITRDELKKYQKLECDTDNLNNSPEYMIAKLLGL